MKLLRSLPFAALFMALAFAIPLTSLVTLTSGCNAPSTRVAQVKTLRAVAESRDATMKIATNLLANGKISVDQWQRIANFHDQKLQPAYNLSVAAVQANLDSIASPDLLALLTQFVALVAPYSSTPIPVPQ